MQSIFTKIKNNYIMFKFRFIALCFITFVISNILNTALAINIGVLVPLQHQALDEITMGIKEVINEYNSKQIKSKQIKVTVVNAQGDQTLLRQLIMQMKKNNIDYFMPIGTSTTQMCVSLIKNKHIIGVAAEIDHSQLKPKDRKRISFVSDKITPTDILKLIKNFIPKIKRIGLIYSNSEKIFPEVEQARIFCKKNNMNMFFKKVNTVSEIYQFGQSLIKDTDALLVFKDNLIVSGITGLVKLAKQNKKLLITEDDGSVKNGANFALGVPEKKIGTIAAQLLLKILKNGFREEYKMVIIDDISIFYNPITLKYQEYINQDDLKKIAKTLSYKIYSISKNKELL